MQLLDAGFDEVIWIDSDMLVTRDIRPLFHALDEAVFVATEHTCSPDRYDHDGAGLRAQLWQLPVGRILPTPLNSGVLRATRRHYRLMERWWELLQSDEYQTCQRNREWLKRPIHMQGDQDVLTALLSSTEFAHIPLRALRRGKDIVQFDGVWGYTTAERTRNLLGDGPTFIHSMGCKPWVAPWKSERRNDLREYLKMVYLDVSPYTLSSAKFRPDLGCDTNWMSRTLQVQCNPSIASDAAPSAHRPADGRLSRHCSAYKTCVSVDVSTKIWHQMICYILQQPWASFSGHAAFIKLSSRHEPLLRYANWAPGHLALTANRLCCVFCY